MVTMWQYCQQSSIETFLLLSLPFNPVRSERFSSKLKPVYYYYYYGFCCTFLFASSTTKFYNNLTMHDWVAYMKIVLKYNYIVITNCSIWMRKGNFFPEFKSSTPSLSQMAHSTLKSTLFPINSSQLKPCCYSFHRIFIWNRSTVDFIGFLQAAKCPSERE